MIIDPFDLYEPISFFVRGQANDYGTLVPDPGQEQIDRVWQLPRHAINKDLLQEKRRFESIYSNPEFGWCVDQQDTLRVSLCHEHLLDTLVMPFGEAMRSSEGSEQDTVSYRFWMQTYLEESHILHLMSMHDTKLYKQDPEWQAQIEVLRELDDAWTALERLRHEFMLKTVPLEKFKEVGYTRLYHRFVLRRPLLPPNHYGAQHWAPDLEQWTLDHWQACKVFAEERINAYKQQHWGDDYEQ